MEIDDFSYIRCSNCKNVIILPIPYKNNRTLLSSMCDEYNELNECCDDASIAFADIKFGMKEKYIKITDLPLVLRKEFPPEVTHEFACGKHLLFVTKHDGTKITISTDGINLTIDDGYKVNNIQLMDD